jgi:glycosyltransferase involved in cell wall biosynthesis
VRGYDVTFVEQPHDVRWLREFGMRAWVSQLSGRARSHGVGTGTPQVIERTTLVPPYRGSAAQAVESALLGRVLRRWDRPDVTIVATTPWQWPAISRLTRARKVFDCADDWGMLVPTRRDAVAAMLKRVGLEADAVVTDSPWLAELFARPDVTVVRNGADDRLLATPLTDPPQARAMAYTGTLSERLDTGLLHILMTALPDWRIDLYGECRYKGYRDQPAPELASLLAEFAGRLSWHGLVSREDLASRLDLARVFLLPHRLVGAVRGDSMKLYDYAARGRPIVSTLWIEDLAETAPPGTTIAEAGEPFVRAVTQAEAGDPEQAVQRRMWAETNSWSSRWNAWEHAVFSQC